MGRAGLSPGVRAAGTFTLGKNMLHKNSSLVPTNICCFPGGWQGGARAPDRLRAGGFATPQEGVCVASTDWGWQTGF